MLYASSAVIILKEAAVGIPSLGSSDMTATRTRATEKQRFFSCLEKERGIQIWTL